MSIFGDIIYGVLGGLAAKSERKDSERATKEATQEAGRQNRATAEFQADLDYYYNQKLRGEKARALDSNYRQFSTVPQFAPGFQRGTGLDALPAKPKAKEYGNG